MLLWSDRRTQNQGDCAKPCLSVQEMTLRYVLHHRRPFTLLNHVGQKLLRHRKMVDMVYDDSARIRAGFAGYKILNTPFQMLIYRLDPQRHQVPGRSCESAAKCRIITLCAEQGAISGVHRVSHPGRPANYRSPHPS